MTIKSAIRSWLCKILVVLACAWALPGRAHAAEDSAPKFLFLTSINGTPWYLLKLPADDNMLIVAWDEANNNPMCLATVGEGAAASDCRRPYQTTTSDDARGQIAQIGQRNSKNQLIGTLTCDSAKYIATYGQVNRNNQKHWCNIARAKLENSGIARQTSIFPIAKANDVLWHFMALKGEKQGMLVAWDKTNNNVMCLATVGSGNPTDYNCRRPKNTLSPDDLNKLVNQIGKRDSQNQLIGTLTCDSANYIALYGRVDQTNKDHWCVYAKAVLGPDTPKLTPEEDKKAEQYFQKLEQSGKYPILDRSTSLAGPDTNHNGVRDDIEAWINKNWPEPKENKAVMQFARGYQMEVTSDRSDVNRIRTIEKAILERAVDCMRFSFPDGIRDERVYDEIKAFTLNTKERIRAFYAYDKLLSGTASAYSFKPEDGCDK